MARDLPGMHLSGIEGIPAMRTGYENRSTVDKLNPLVVNPHSLHASLL